MIRPATLLLLALAAAAGGALFTVSYDVASLEDRLATLNRRIVEDQEAIHVLRAEWSFLNQPARIEELSQRYLDLRPLAGAQIGNFDMLPVRLPTLEPPQVDRNDDLAAPTALAALTAETSGPRPLIKPWPPARPPVRRTAPMAIPAPATAVIPVAGRTLDDLLAEIASQDAPQ